MAIFFLKDAVSPEVYYNGKILPKDKAPLRVDVPDKNVDYHESQLPADKKTPQPLTRDLSNNPSRLVINGYLMPADVAVYITLEKLIAQSNILDGPSVFERITRKPYQLEFEFTIRTQLADGTGYIFPQEETLNFWTNVWVPDSVLRVDNTFLNKLGIQEMIANNGNLTTVRGSKNVPLRLTAWENQPGQSLIIK